MARGRSARPAMADFVNTEAPPAPPPALEAPPPACRACRHFLALDEAKGLCRRFPPSHPTNVLTAHGRMLAHPLVTASDVCGEFAPA